MRVSAIKIHELNWIIYNYFPLVKKQNKTINNLYDVMHLPKHLACSWLLVYRSSQLLAQNVWHITNLLLSLVYETKRWNKSVNLGIQTYYIILLALFTTLTGVSCYKCVSCEWLGMLTLNIYLTISCHFGAKVFIFSFFFSLHVSCHHLFPDAPVRLHMMAQPF